jgi:hypothetical protein
LVIGIAAQQADSQIFVWEGHCAGGLVEFQLGVVGEGCAQYVGRCLCCISCAEEEVNPDRRVIDLFEDLPVLEGLVSLGRVGSFQVETYSEAAEDAASDLIFEVQVTLLFGVFFQVNRDGRVCLPWVWAVPAAVAFVAGSRDEGEA